MFFSPLLGLAAFVSAHAPRNLDSTQVLRLQKARSTCARDVTCILTEEATEGPFYVEHPLIRGNLTEDRDGVPFTLAINVLNVNNCTAVEGVFVDVWHADAGGVYSGWASDHLSASSPPGPFNVLGNPIDDSRWLRGVLPTNESGIAQFETVFPGWYYGRSTHIHIRIHSGNITLSHGVLLGGGKVAHTGQLFFSDALVVRVSKTREPYKSRREELKPMLNGDDGIYLHSRGNEQIVTMMEDEDGAFYGEVTVGIDPTADRHEPQRPGRPPPGPLPLQLWIAIAVVIVAATWLVGKWYRRRILKKREGYAPLPQPTVAEVLERGRAEQRSEYGSTNSTG